MAPETPNLFLHERKSTGVNLKKKKSYGDRREGVSKLRTVKLRSWGRGTWGLGNDLSNAAPHRAERDSEAGVGQGTCRFSCSTRAARPGSGCRLGGARPCLLTSGAAQRIRDATSEGRSRLCDRTRTRKQKLRGPPHSGRKTGALASNVALSRN